MLCMMGYAGVSETKFCVKSSDFFGLRFFLIRPGDPDTSYKMSCVVSRVIIIQSGAVKGIFVLSFKNCSMRNLWIASRAPPAGRIGVSILTTFFFHRMERSTSGVSL